MVKHKKNTSNPPGPDMPDPMDKSAFLMAFQEALLDDTIQQGMWRLIESQMDRLADRVVLKLDARIKHLTDQIKQKDMRIAKLEADVEELRFCQDDHEQYWGRVSLMFFRIEETTGEDTDDLIIKF